jgi:hypothetical protein
MYSYMFERDNEDRSDRKQSFSRTSIFAFERTSSTRKLSESIVSHWSMVILVPGAQQDSHLYLEPEVLNICVSDSLT